MNERFDPNETLRVLAEELGDPSEVDWKEARDNAPGREGTLEGLQLIQRVANAHRSAREDHEPGDPSVSSGQEKDRQDRDGHEKEETVQTPLFGWGPLRVMEKIGEGGFAEVYRAWDPSLQRHVALKLRREGASSGSSRWVEEARHLAGVRHSNVLVVHGSAVHDDRAGIWTDLIHGETLAEGVREKGPLGAREAAILVMDVCMALAAVHEAGLVHGDVKASNVMRESGGRIVLMDFGSGHYQDDGRDGERSGTPMISAPELIEGGSTTPASDVYALGVLLYWLVSGEYPYEAESMDQLRERMRAGESIPLRERRPDLSPAFVQIVEGAMRSDPNERWAGPAELERALAGLLSGERPVSPSERSMSSRYLWFSSAAILLTLVVVAVVWWRVPRPPSYEPMELSSYARLIVAGDELSVDLRMMRLEGADAHPLGPESSLSTGMRLVLELESSETADVYVLNEDEFGELFVLFPVDGVDLSNPLEGGRSHLLPGRLHDRQQSWVVTSSGGMERFLVVVTRDPLPHFEGAISEFRRASAERGADRSADGASSSEQVVESLRGVGGLREVEPGESMGGVILPRIAEALLASAEELETLWVWYLSYPNPVVEGSDGP